jgi:hypothetical protein
MKKWFCEGWPKLKCGTMIIWSRSIFLKYFFLNQFFLKIFLSEQKTYSERGKPSMWRHNHFLLLKGKSLRNSTWIGRGFFKMLQISLFGVSINIIVLDTYFSFLSKKCFVSICGVFIFFYQTVRGLTLENSNWPIFYVFVARFLRS